MNLVANVFNFGEQTVRALVRDGKPWYIAKDIAEVLGYQNTAQAIGKHCKNAMLLKHLPERCLKMPNRGMMIIPESDVYQLVLGSTLPSADRFRDWACENVFPEIRRTGSYISPAAAHQLPMTYLEALECMVTSLKENAVLVEHKKQLEQTLEIQQPNAIRGVAMISINTLSAGEF